MKLQQMNADNEGSYFVTLPRQIVLAKGWQKGDNIRAKITDRGNIELSK